MKPVIRTSTRKVLDYTNDDSDLLTEESSMSDSTVNHDVEKEDTDDSEHRFTEVEPEQATLDYTELTIEEPPSFFDSQYEPVFPPTVEKCFKRPLTSKNNDDDDLDDVFQKKSTVRKKHGPFSVLDNEGSSSSQASSSQNSRKPRRKPRKTREFRVQNDGNPFLKWKQKHNETNKKSVKLFGVGTEEVGVHDNAEGQTSVCQESQGDDSEYGSDSSASTSTTVSNEPPPGRKPLKHITIALDDEKELMQQKALRHEELQIAGINVKFPVKPYPSQIAVMNKLIQGCKKEEHCLLESPTGSGKTLALLCGVLAWQEHIKDEFKKQNAEATQRAVKRNEMEFRIDGESAASHVPPSAETKNDEPRCSAARQWKNTDEFVKFSKDDKDQPPSKKFCQSTSPSGSTCQAEKLNDDRGNLFTDDMTMPDFFEETRSKKPPTVYYGSRTHKQIEQVVRELKKTAYAYKKILPQVFHSINSKLCPKLPRMTILSSREFTCIQQTDKNKTEVCTKLLDPTKGLGCKFHHENTRNRISSNKALNRLGINGPWDIEDLVEIGRQQSACPYFAARDLMIEADIVFCPYNYLVDPNIRSNMQINLEGQIVILDEAHNIEEMSREVGSLSFREDKIMEVQEEINILCYKRGFDFETYNTIKIYLRDFLQFLKVNNLNTIDRFSDTASSDFWTGVQLCELFNIHSLGNKNAKNFQTAAAAAIMDFNTAKEETSKKQQSDIVPAPVVSPVAKRFLEDLTLALQTMASEKLANDYRACIVESNVRDFGKVADNTWVHRGSVPKRLRSLQMLCMNPAVVFAPLANLARSVVLASGTLSPISSFQSELATVFPHKLDANHVVPKENVYIRGIPCGPNGVVLKANYANVNSWNFQDELGRLILNVCKVIPHGVLCFFSSYSMMQRQIDRWKQNSCWEQLERVKHVLQEPRGSSNLEPVMQEFREIIQSTSESSNNGITGALLLAVFRGKVAEGIDFSDNEARCVMAIGIPYAVRKDPSVDMKFNYNDLNHSKGLLKGGEWYTVQAFRALNQALGRCVRHRNDWGAVLLIDQRFLEKSSYNYLPKWVKTMWRNSTRYNLIEELENFVAYRVQRTKKENLNTAGS